MDEATIKERCEKLHIEWLKDESKLETMDLALLVYRAAYADGLDAAAKIANEERVDYESTGEESDRVYNQACADIEESIRQHAKEMGHE